MQNQSVSVHYSVSTSVGGHAAALSTDEFKDPSIVLNFTQDPVSIDSQESTMRVSFNDLLLINNPTAPRVLRWSMPAPGNDRMKRKLPNRLSSYPVTSATG